MRIIHTSDWHLGNRLQEKTRTEEFRDFTEWLLVQLREQKADVLLISGDIFDNSTPGDSTLELYHDFLSKADQTGCRYIIMTGGNHDGVAQLEASAPLLKRHHAYMVSSLSRDNIEKCLIPVADEAGNPAALVCAVPYLRPREVAEESSDSETDDAYIRGIAKVYKEVAKQAEAWKSAHEGLPVICMGHLSVSGAEVTDSTRRLIGTLETVNAGIFSPVFDYVALGHIHKGYSLAEGRIAYSGSPLPMGIDETADRHVLLVEISEGKVTREKLAVPSFTLHVKHSCATQEELDTLPDLLRTQETEAGSKRTNLQLVYTGTDLSVEQLRTKAYKMFHRLYHYKLIVNRPGMYMELNDEDNVQDLSTLTPESLFEKCLEKYNLEAAKLAAIKNCFRQALDSLNN